MWSVSTILTGLYSFMIETGATLGSVETSTSQKLKMARQSLDFNVRDPTFCKLFPEYLELHEERMTLRRDANPEVSAPSVSHESTAVVHAEDGVNGLFATAAGVIAILSIVFAMRFI
jgi:ubiquitin-conjugating enzyme E2 J2